MKRKDSSGQKPPVHSQGKIVVQCDGLGLLVMMPDGSVHGAADAKEADTLARTWIKNHMRGDAVNVATIEWNGCAPPKS